VRREEYLQPGAYDPLPHSIMASGELTATAKVVAAALLGHLRGDNEWVYPSAHRLAELTGGSVRSMRRALDDLQAAGHLEAQERPGQATRYRFVTSVKLSGVATLEPLPSCQGTPAKLSDHPCQKGGGTPAKLSPEANHRNETQQQQPAAAGILALLEEAGIGQPTRSSLAQDRTITRARVLRLQAMAQGAGNPAGQLVALLRGGETGIPKHLTPKAAAQLINTGRVETIQGLSIEPGTRAKYNSTGVYIEAPGVQSQLVIGAADLEGALE